jgi:hypothetical protein
MARKRRYQSGGLAEVAGIDPYDEDAMEEAASTGALEAVATPAEEIVDNTVSSGSVQESLKASRALNKMTYEKALERLKVGRDALMAMNPQDKSSKWLALAQGMLAPTRTGGFGESVSTTAGLLRQQQELTNKSDMDRQQALQEINKQEADAEAGYAERDIDLTEKEATQATQARARMLPSYNGIVKSGDQAAKLGLDPSKDHVVRVDSVMDPSGNVTTKLSTLEGEVLDVAVSTNPETVSGTTTAREEAEGATGTHLRNIDAAVGAMAVAPKIKDAYRILAKIKANGGKTSGLKTDLLKFTEYFGITEDTIPEGVDLLTLQSKVGGAILDQLLRLTGSKTDFEYRKIEEQHSRLTANVDTNMKVLDEMSKTYDNVIERGYTSTGQLKDQNYGQYARNQIDSYRKQQSATGGGGPSRVPPTAAVDIFLDRIGRAPDKAAELKLFQKRYDISDDLKVELRKLGVGI